MERLSMLDALLTLGCCLAPRARIPQPPAEARWLLRGIAGPGVSALGDDAAGWQPTGTRYARSRNFGSTGDPLIRPLLLAESGRALDFIHRVCLLSGFTLTDIHHSPTSFSPLHHRPHRPIFQNSGSPRFLAPFISDSGMVSRFSS